MGKDADWIDWCANPSKPAFRVPKGSVDAHCHIFGPGDRFPFAPERKYTPCDASAEQLFALRDFLGFERNVIVQATCHGADNRALMDALGKSDGKARGIAAVKSSVTGEELRTLHAAGVRGVRFNFVKRLVDALPFDSLSQIAKRVAGLGWHIVIYFEAADLEEYFDFFLSLPTVVVVDHMGRPDVSKDAFGPEFDRFARLMEHKNFWCKTTCPERLSHAGPHGYPDVVPFARRIVETFPDRVLWGTDWPHPNMTSHMPDDGKLVDFIPRIAATPALQKALLVDNPMRLYWPEEKSRPYDDVPGTIVFDERMARLGYHLNQFCMSLMRPDNRERFKADNRAFLDEWPMSEEQKQAVISRDYNKMLSLGGNIYFLAKIFSSDGYSFQYAASTMTGMTEEDYLKMMVSGGRSPDGNRFKSEWDHGQD